jgi:Zn-dependent protease
VLVLIYIRELFYTQMPCYLQSLFVRITSLSLEDDFMPQLSIIQHLCIWALPLLFAITLHEAAHAYVANRCGDNTAKMLGRLSLNPIRHIDPLGTILIPILLGLLTQFNFLLGYAKPVPIDWRQLRKPKRDMVFVAMAGPLANLVMALLWAICYKIATLLEMSWPSLFLLLTARTGILINLVLFLLNLIPIPPLDGSRILISLLPKKAALAYSKIEPYGLIILILLLITGGLGMIFSPFLEAALNAVKFLFKI